MPGVASVQIDNVPAPGHRRPGLSARRRACRSAGWRSRGSTTIRTSPSTACSARPQRRQIASGHERRPTTAAAAPARRSTRRRRSSTVPACRRSRYRVGTHPDFKATLLARLSSTDYPALAGARPRATTDDYTIALLDAFAATLADVLTFYQERIANESYLRTATERRSVLELARLIGYQLAPGVAASTALAFTLEEAPGQPSQAARSRSRFRPGRACRACPIPDQDPQTFETVAAIVAQRRMERDPGAAPQPIEIGPGLTELVSRRHRHAAAARRRHPVRRRRATQDRQRRWDVRWSRACRSTPPAARPG